MKKRNWTATDLAKQAKRSNSIISAILNDTRTIGPDAARDVAHALHISEVQVFVRAGLLSGLEPDQAQNVLDDPQVVEYLELFERLKQRPGALPWFLEIMRSYLRYNP